ncbi:hypothetical protein HPP92_028699 [Vanilla planifolia]|uniref:Uncharacterized protein n=1 Tax=Vanilla planifolia TaxID=51239 RepID=A0A835P6U8_VANPL|nr:hypothetical protein HPP92_028699 [Vanilla planifolia]KAG0446744.1 hypothetical protein HPP92_028684 [Vanilla planifolia]
MQGAPTISPTASQRWLSPLPGWLSKHHALSSRSPRHFRRQAASITQHHNSAGSGSGRRSTPYAHQPPPCSSRASLRSHYARLFTVTWRVRLPGRSLKRRRAAFQLTRSVDKLRRSACAKPVEMAGSARKFSPEQPSLMSRKKDSRIVDVAGADTTSDGYHPQETNYGVFQGFKSFELSDKFKASRWQPALGTLRQPCHMLTSSASPRIHEFNKVLHSSSRFRHFLPWVPASRLN